jgi:prevent-host-death family protein
LHRPFKYSTGTLCINADMLSKSWQLQEAKNHFSEVVERAIKNGAQTVTKRGKLAVTIIPGRGLSEVGCAPQITGRVVARMSRSSPGDHRTRHPARTHRFDS